MRPESIVSFERSYFGALGIGMVNGLLYFGATVEALLDDPAIAALNADPAFASMSADPVFMTIVRIFMAAILVLSLVFGIVVWYLIARRASNVTKWVYTVTWGIGLPFTLFQLTKLPGGVPQVALTVAGIALQANAVRLLFRPDAVAWLTSKPTGAQPA